MKQTAKLLGVTSLVLVLVACGKPDPIVDDQEVTNPVVPMAEKVNHCEQYYAYMDCYVASADE